MAAESDAPESLRRSRGAGLQRLDLAPIEPGKQRLELRVVQAIIPSRIAGQVKVVSSSRL